MTASLEWRRAAVIDLANQRGGVFSQSAVLGGDQVARQAAHKRGVGRAFQAIGVLHQAVRNIGQQLFRAFRRRTQRRNYFDCHGCQQRGEAACIDGAGFRLLVGRHRLFLQVEGQAQQGFDLQPRATPALVQTALFQTSRPFVQKPMGSA